MSERSVAFIRRAARRILSDNREPTVRKRLKGPLFRREKACKRAGDIIALTLPNRTGREWGGRSENDGLVYSLRAIATDARATADMRIDALERLAVIDGLMPINTLGDNPQDAWIKTLVAPQKQAQPATLAQPAASNGTLDAVLDFSNVGR